MSQGLAFFCCYAEHRKRYDPSVSSSDVTGVGQGCVNRQEQGGNVQEGPWVHEQEVLYNMGCAYRDLQLNHFASEFYHRALVLSDSFEELRGADVIGDCSSGGSSGGSLTSAVRLPLTSESAHNLILIYKQAGNRPAAMAIMRRYMTF